MTHELKTHPLFFKDIVSGIMRFNVRKNDRNFKDGDFVKFREYVPWRNRPYTGRKFIARITYVLRHEDFPEGINPGYCVFGFRV